MDFMMVHRSEITAAVFWFVIAGFFGVILYGHVRDKNFLYPFFTYRERNNIPSTEEMVGAQLLQQTRSGPVEARTYRLKNGNYFQVAYINGIELDDPSRRIVSDINNHIVVLNAQKQDDSVMLIILDFVALISALFSGGYELIKIRARAAA